MTDHASFPPLPDPLLITSDLSGNAVHHFSAEQMREYARVAIEHLSTRAEPVAYLNSVGLAKHRVYGITKDYYKDNERVPYIPSFYDVPVFSISAATVAEIDRDE